MKTEKLYELDCHIAAFDARVLSCAEGERGWEVILDATAFFPGGGGQACDLGTLGEARVVDMEERDTQIIHLCDRPLEAGQILRGEIDYGRRFDLMQQHTGEHIVSGIVHRRYGYHNTGFHVGADVLTVDFDGVIPAEDLDAIEQETNRALWENVPVRCWTPAPEELSGIFYRTKRALPWPVRLVQIPGWDSCACCGIHVGMTGEVGLVKIFSSMGFRGGTRIEMACGKRALDLLNESYRQNRQVSQAFSVQLPHTGEAARRMNALLDEEKRRYGVLQLQMFRQIAEGYTGQGDVLRFEKDLDAVKTRELADAIAQVCGGVAAVFSGSDEAGWQFCLVSRNSDLRPLGKDMIAVLRGRGGGRPDCQQGRVAADEKAIRVFFET